MMKYCFGVDVGGTTVKLGLFTVEGELLDKWEIKTYTENEGERILPDVAEAIKGKIAEKLLKAEEICGIVAEMGRSRRQMHHGPPGRCGED